MDLDVPTLIVVRNLNLLAVAVTMAFLLSWRRSLPARYAVAGMLTQSVAWSLLLVVGWMDHRPGYQPVSVVAVGLLLLSLWLIWQGLRLWLGRPVLAVRSLWVLAFVMACYAASFGSFTVRVVLGTWSTALVLALIAIDLLRPQTVGAGGWRYLIAACMGSAAVLTTLRGLVTLLEPVAYPGLRSGQPINVAGLMFSNVSMLLISVGILLAYREEVERELQRLAVTDGLTGVLNRRAWTERAVAMHAEARRYGHPLIVLMIDLDGFKQINDTYGHVMGDRALQLVGQLLREELRAGDLIGRYGGEEFSLVLSHQQEAFARHLDERLRTLLAERSQEQLGLRLDYSAGLTALRPTDKSLDDLVKRADDALYAAKRAGRGRLHRAD